MADGARFFNLNFWDKSGEIGVNNMHFRAFLGNQPLDLVFPTLVKNTFQRGIVMSTIEMEVGT